jgi:hypothetical protein
MPKTKKSENAKLESVKPSSIFSLVREPDATLKYDLKKTLSDLFREGEYRYENHLKNFLFLVAEGEVYVDGHLHLDWKAGFTDSEKHAAWREQYRLQTPPSGDYGIRGIIINGNLTINGSLINDNSNDGPFLLVTGNLTAWNAVAGGAYIRVYGNADIEEVTYSHYNDGSFHIEGNLTTTICISDDHDFSAKHITAKYDYNSHDGDRHDEDDNGNYLIPKKLKSLLNPNLGYEDILSTLGRGESVLKNTKHKKEKTYDDWLREVKSARSRADWRVLKRVPETFKTEELCTEAVKFYGENLKFVPPSLITRALVELAVTTAAGGLKFVPKEMMDESLCRLAVEQDGIALEGVPEQLKTRELCKLAAKHHTRLQYLPKPFANDKEIHLEILKRNYYEFTELPPKLQKEKDYMIAAMLGSEGYSAFMYVKHGFNKSATQDAVMLGVIETDIKAVHHIPGYAMTSDLVAVARKRYEKNLAWQDIENRHSLEFWRYAGMREEYVIKIENDLTHDARFDKAFEEVWLANWTEDFVIHVLQHTKPYAEINLIPESFFTKKIVSAALEHDEYGYYRDRMPKRVLKLAR